MRDITIQRKLRERTHIIIDPDKHQQSPPGHDHILCLAFLCETCKTYAQHDIIAKQVYTESDVISFLKAALNFAHYQCGCDAKS